MLKFFSCVIFFALSSNLAFSESKTVLKTGEKIPFFNLGPKNKWQNILEPKIIKKIENSFNVEMKELGYL